MKLRRIICTLLLVFLCIALTGCGMNREEPPKAVTLIVKAPPIGLGNVPGVGEAEAYDLFIAAAEKFSEQYDKYDVSFDISRYFYLDEQEQLADKYGTAEAADVFFSGSYNTPVYAARGWLVPLDDIIDEELRSDIDETFWSQNTIDGFVYTLPFHHLQNTLLVNRLMMVEAGLEQYIPEEDAIAHWSTEEFNTVLEGLKASLDGDNTFPFMMYAANSQGDNHIMTLLRAYGGTLYGKDGNFKVDTPEGIRALQWIKDLDDKELIPKGAENLELLDCVNLFYNGQLAICMGNITNMWDSWNKGLDIFAVNFPSPDGNGYATSGTNGFCVFDNGDADRIQASKDFIRFIYTDEELMKYTLGTLPVNKSVIENNKDEIRMIEAYGDNSPNIVDNVRSNPGWQGVRDVFHLNIRDLLIGAHTPEETARNVDQSCNAALLQGRNAEEKK